MPDPPSSTTTANKSQAQETDTFQDKYLEEICNDPYEWEQGDTGKLIKGGLRRHLSFWNRHCSNKFVLDTVQDGYKIPFHSLPEASQTRNNRSATENESFVSSAILQLLEEGRIQECICKPKVVNPLSVSTNSSGKKRLILDLRKVNLHVWKEKVKYEDLKTARLYLDIHKYMFTFDLKSGYHHIEIFHEHTDYLGFSWTFGSHVRYFKFLVLPFGLSSAPYIFTKIMRTLVKKWRSEGKEIILYLDDGLGIGNSKSETKSLSQEVQKDLKEAGFIINQEKSNLSPQQICTWLGFVLDTNQGVISPVQSKIIRIKEEAANFVFKRSVHVRSLASVVGQIIAMTPALGNVTRLMTRSIISSIQAAPSWQHSVSITSDAKRELEFWKTNIENLKPVPMKTDCSYHKVVYSDASGVGAGGYIVKVDGAVAHGAWDQVQKSKSSTWRELKAVEIILKSFLSFLAGTNVKWFTDSQNVVRIVEVGSGKPELLQIAYSIYFSCVEHGITLKMDWVPRSLNEIADSLSRIIDYDDWAISDILFQRFNAMWGPHTVDRFADEHNKKVKRFNSRYWNPGSEAVDAFTEKWTNENNWLVPPINMIAMTVLHMKADRAIGTLIVPNWPSAPFWPLLACSKSNQIQFIPQVIAFRRFPASTDSFVVGRSGRTIFKEITPRFHMLALRLSFVSSS